MSYNKSPMAFDDIRAAFDKALATPKGIRIVCPSKQSATVMRSRFNYFRKLDREQNAKTYPPDHPMHKLSAYDKLVLRIYEIEPHVVYIEPRSIEDLLIQEIT